MTAARPSLDDCMRRAGAVLLAEIIRIEQEALDSEAPAADRVASAA